MHFCKARDSSGKRSKLSSSVRHSENFEFAQAEAAAAPRAAAVAVASVVAVQRRERSRKERERERERERVSEVLSNQSRPKNKFKTVPLMCNLVLMHPVEDLPP